MSGAATSMPILLSAASAITREQRMAEDGDPAAMDSADGPAFGDLISSLEERPQAGGEAAAGRGEAEGADGLVAACLKQLLSDGGQSIDDALPTAGDSPDDRVQPGPAVVLPAALLQLLGLASTAAQTETPPEAARDGDGSQPRTPAIGVTAAADFRAATPDAGSLPMPTDGEAQPQPAMEILPSLFLAKLNAAGGAARAKEDTEVKLSVLGKETYFPAVAAPAPELDLIARATGALQQSYRSEDRSRANGAAPVSSAEGSDTETTESDEGQSGRVMATLRAREETIAAIRPAHERPDERRAGDDLTASRAGMAFEVAASEPKPVSASLTPTLQIARRVASELAAEGATGASQARGETGSVATGQAGSVLRVINIRLEPEALGQVTVRLSLKDNVINLHLSASHLETALAIEKDRETLSSALKSAGYVVDGVTSQVGDGLRIALQTPSGSGVESQQNAFLGGSQSQAGNPSARGRGGAAPQYADERFSGGGPGVDDGQTGRSQNAGGALYV